jgi:hypothetical protein
MNHTYKPYTGGAGPTAQQKESNTLYLGELLTQHNIPYTLDRKWAKQNWGGDELSLVIKKGKVKIVAAYDRWGYVVESNNFIDIDIDQAEPQATVNAIVNWYNA